MISEEQAEAAIDYMKANAKRIGLLKGKMVAAEEGLRRIKSLKIVEIRQHNAKGTVAEVEALAYASSEYGEALKDLENSTADYETERIYLNAADLQFRAWQSQTSAMKRGI